MDSDLSALSTGDARALAHLLNDLLRAVYFDVVNRDLRLPQYGGDYDVRPFPLPDSPVDVAAMKVRLRLAEKTAPADEHSLARRIKYAFSFFMFGEPLPLEALEHLFGTSHSTSIDEGLRLGLFVRADGQAIRMNGLSLFSRKLPNGDVLHLFADTPPHFERRTGRQRVYIGADSYELVNRISRLKDDRRWTMDDRRWTILELGSGSGIQLVAALKQHPRMTKAIGMERDRRAANVSVFNAALNGVADRIAIVASDRDLDAELDGCPVSLAVSNPPFLAMPRWVDVDAVQLDLQTLFPAAGWGGDDGLDVTKSFIEIVMPKLARGMPFIIYSQFAGDRSGPTRIREYSQNAGFEFSFEPLPSQRVFTREEAADTVARLIVSALLARREPQRVQTRVRQGSPEQKLVAQLSERIQESYRTLGISHFHDGFAVLTRPA